MGATVKKENMKNKLIGIALGGVLLALFCAPVEAQQAVKVPKLGWLFLRPGEPGYGRNMTLRALSDLGYMENKNVSFDIDTPIIS